MSDTLPSVFKKPVGDNNENPIPRLSALLQKMANKAENMISLGQISDSIKDRSFGAFLLVFALPNIVPFPPGATLILALPLIFVAWQMFARKTHFWLPQKLNNYSFKSTTFTKLVDRTFPWLVRMENFVKPRFWFIKTDFAERALGLFILILAIVVLIPIPFGNLFPAFALAVIGAAHMEHDGYLMTIGIALGVLALLIVFAIFLIAEELFTYLF